jgi:hypothetical protein
LLLPPVAEPEPDAVAVEPLVEVASEFTVPPEFEITCWSGLSFEPNK